MIASNNAHDNSMTGAAHSINICGQQKILLYIAHSLY